MRAYNIIILFIFSFISFFGNAQVNADDLRCEKSINFLGEPRKQLKTSFYNPELQSGDWLRDYVKIEQKKLTFLGVESKIKTNGRTIVIDAGEKTTTEYIIFRGEDNIVVTKNKVFVEKDNRLYQIPIKFSGDNSVNADNLDVKDKTKISKYIIESFKFSGSTPSAVEIQASNKEYDLFIFNSSFIPNDISIKRINNRSTQIFELAKNVFYVMNN